MKITLRTFFTVLSMLFISAGMLYAENDIQIYHQSPTIIEQGETLKLTFSAPGINPNKVQEAVLYYRYSGDIAYKQKRAVLNQSEFTVSLNLGKSEAGSLEYYFEIRFLNKKSQKWPLNMKITGPARVEIVEAQKASGRQQQSIGYTILSPEPGESIAVNDALIAITLFYDSSVIDTSSVNFRLFLDDNDITDEAIANPYFFSYAPELLAPGTHNVSLQLLTNDSTATEVATWEFNVAGAGLQENIAAVQTPDQRFIQNARVELRARNQMISGATNDVYSGNLRFSGGKGSFRYTAYGRLTSQQDPRFQPQNRYGLELYAGNWFELRAGHIYPFLSPLTISGRRVLGINTALHFFDRAINIEFLYGNMNQSIPNLYGFIEPQYQRFNNTVVDTTYALNFNNNGAGTYRRKVMGGRLAFGRGRTFQFGLNLLKIEDDTTSINIVKNYFDAVEMAPNSLGGLSAEDRRVLQNNPELLAVNDNPTPKGNVVASADLMFALDDANIRFQGNAGISLLNNDISNGILDSETAEELGFVLDSETADLLDRLSWLIIINENMNALPFRFDLQNESVNPFFPTGIFGAQSELSFNYFDNNLRIQYRWIGPNFESLANSTIRNDIAGFTVTDRFNLFENRIYVTLGYENLQDNVISSRDATTKTISYRGNISWFPVAPELPRLSVGVMYRNRDNSVPLFNPFIGSGLQNAAVINYRQIADGEAVITANPRKEQTVQFNSSLSQRFNLFGINHTARLSYSLLNTTDETFAFGDTKSSVVSFNLINRFNNMPLQTTVGISYNSTETLSGLGAIDIFGVNLGGSLFLLDNKLNIDLAVALTQNNAGIIPLGVNMNGTPQNSADDYYEGNTQAKTNTDSHSYIFSASARYNITPNHAVMLYSRLTNVTSNLAVNVPNDRLLQARYIFSF